MRSFWFLILIACSLHLQGQSVIGRAKYQAEKAVPSSPILAPGAYMKELPPLPQVPLLPNILPQELSMSREQYLEWEKLLQANRLMTSGNSAEASVLYAAYLEKHPETVPVRVALADSLFAQKAYLQAEAEYLKVLQAVPLHFQALNNLGLMYATSPLPEQKDPEKALQLSLRARHILPNSHHVWSTISMAQYQLGNYRKAGENAQVAMQLAQRTGAPTSTFVSYLLQIDRCRLALEATSILE